MNLNLLHSFKDKILNGAVYGLFMKSADSAFVETAGYAGFDFAILDMEHGPVGFESMQNNVRAAELAQILPVIRVSSLSETEISKALDIGALGVQVPQIRNACEAKAVVKAAKFHPDGERGVCRFVRAAGYSETDRQTYFRQANEALIIIQLEGEEALENIDQILLVEGIDIIFIGPYDLSQSLGVPGQTMHPKVVEKMESIVAQAAANGTIVGTFTDNLDTLTKWKLSGVKYLSYSVDVGIFLTACQEIVKNAQAI